ncbi:SNF2 helicase-associated domain-containing protein [Streptomyces sp. NPDC058877]|uniref:SNF2 helicase-associated domain-containing protein n=1 Tax=Streptomyces sp. NPDC058877 TaxID=3346665 RepID=UPI00369E00F0
MPRPTPPLCPPSPALPRELARRATVFLPAEPPRAGRIAFWDPAGEPAFASVDLSPGTCVLTVVEEDGISTTTVPVHTLSVRDALPLLARARLSNTGSPSTAFWGAASLLALELVARGLLLPGLTPGDHDTWRAGPLGPGEWDELRTLAASMPPTAHTVPLSDEGPLLLPEPEALLHAFVDAVADTLPRTPAAPLAAGGPAFAADAPQTVPEQRAWTADLAAVHDAGVRLSLRLELPHFAAEARVPPGFRAVLQLHSVADPSLVADAAEVWSGAQRVGPSFGPRAPMDALLALRRAARAWPPLSPLLSEAVPDALELTDEEVTELLGPATGALEAAGVQIYWPRELTDRLTARAVIGPETSGGNADGNPTLGTDIATDIDHPGGARSSGPLPLLGADSLLAFNWRFSIGEQELSRAELDRIAEAGRPLVRLRDRWVLVDPAEAR